MANDSHYAGTALQGIQNPILLHLEIFDDTIQDYHITYCYLAPTLSVLCDVAQVHYHNLRVG